VLETATQPAASSALGSQPVAGEIRLPMRTPLASIIMAVNATAARHEVEQEVVAS